MPYRSQRELDEDMEQNPKLAKARVAKAKQAGIPIVSKNNPGYSNGSNGRGRPAQGNKSDPAMDAAIERRMAAFKEKTKKKPEEDETVSKRKKVGY